MRHLARNLALCGVVAAFSLGSGAFAEDSAKAPAPGTDKPAAAAADPLKEKVQALYKEGKKLAKAEDFAGAAAKWEEALKLEPQNAELLNHYAWFLVDTVPTAKREPARAKAMAENALALVGGKNRDILDTLAEVAFQQKDFAKAVELEKQALAPELAGKECGHSKPAELKSQLAKFEKALANDNVARPAAAPGKN